MRGPGGNGTGTAVVAAYVLAGELAAARGDHRAAFGRYEHLLRRYVARGQKQARSGRDFLAPATAKKIRQRDRFFRMLPYLPAKGLISTCPPGPRPPSSCPNTRSPASQRAPALSGLRSEELATSDEGRPGLKGARRRAGQEIGHAC